MELLHEEIKHSGTHSKRCIQLFTMQNVLLENFHGTSVCGSLLEDNAIRYVCIRRLTNIIIFLL